MGGGGEIHLAGKNQRITSKNCTLVISNKMEDLDLSIFKALKATSSPPPTSLVPWVQQYLLVHMSGLESVEEAAFKLRLPCLAWARAMWQVRLCLALYVPDSECSPDVNHWLELDQPHHYRLV